MSNEELWKSGSKLNEAIETCQNHLKSTLVRCYPFLSARLAKLLHDYETRFSLLADINRARLIELAKQVAEYLSQIEGVEVLNDEQGRALESMIASLTCQKQQMTDSVRITPLLF